jgi:ABC-type multidrug transport system fused ATPase/permease subunit
MKILRYKKQLILIPHIIFWFLSFNFWYVILNPGVESTGVIQDFGVGWDWILMINTILLIYCTLPLIWLAKRAKLWVKIIPSVLFLIPIGYIILQVLLPDENKKEAFDLFEFFVKNFLYVVVFHLSIAGAVYFNLKFLLVRYLNKSQFFKYLVSIFALVFGTAVLNYSFFNYFIDKLFPSLYYISYFKIWELVVIIKVYLVTSILVFLFVQYFEMLIEKRDAARNELSALKAQINPHFLFNNLNTIYSMASQYDSRTTDVILKLSDFLRYILYDTSSERIPLEKEVEMIKTYVGLQKERINSEITAIELETSGDFSGVEIAPLLLLPLAENCFKHGVGKDLGNIHIQIGYNNQQLVFSTENNVALREKANENENGGIGILNVEKRLSLIYPDGHSLKYQEKDGVFTLEMKIEMKN